MPFLFCFIFLKSSKNCYRPFNLRPFYSFTHEAILVSFTVFQCLSRDFQITLYSFFCWSVRKRKQFYISVCFQKENGFRILLLCSASLTLICIQREIKLHCSKTGIPRVKISQGETQNSIKESFNSITRRAEKIKIFQIIVDTEKERWGREIKRKNKNKSEKVPYSYTRIINK